MLSLLINKEGIRNTYRKKKKIGVLKLQKFIEKYKQNADIWNNLLGAGLSVIGIIISICLAIINPSNVIIAAAVITCQLIVLVFSLACYHIIAQSKKTIEENNRQVEQNNILCQQLN